MVFGDWSEFHAMFPRGKPMELAAGKKSNTAQFSEMFDRPSERAAATASLSDWACPPSVSAVICVIETRFAHAV